MSVPRTGDDPAGILFRAFARTNIHGQAGLVAPDARRSRLAFEGCGWFPKLIWEPPLY
ncbi:MAG TPA: hypothetical protein PLC40_11370 [Candidatus Hydrogenedentes bacterium]|nr:hypothetical protein [Candidatus Hydrogenedentota bacterium]